MDLTLSPTSAATASHSFPTVMINPEEQGPEVQRFLARINSSRAQATHNNLIPLTREQREELACIIDAVKIKTDCIFIKREIEKIQRFCDAFLAVCPPGMFDFNKLSLAAIVQFSKLLILREIVRLSLSKPLEQLNLNHLSTLFQLIVDIEKVNKKDVNASFFQLARAFITDDTSHDLATLNTFLKAMIYPPDFKFSWMTLEQLRGLTEKIPDEFFDPYYEFNLIDLVPITNYIISANEYSLNEAVQDHDTYSQLACTTTLELLTSLEQLFTAEIAIATKSLISIKRLAKELLSAFQGATNSLQRNLGNYFGRYLIKKITLEITQFKHLRSAVMVRLKLFKEQNFYQMSLDLPAYLNDMFSMQQLRDSIENHLLGGLSLISLLIGQKGATNETFGEEQLIPPLLQNYHLNLALPLNNVFCRLVQETYGNSTFDLKDLRSLRSRFLANVYFHCRKIQNPQLTLKNLIEETTLGTPLKRALKDLKARPLPEQITTAITRVIKNCLLPLKQSVVEALTHGDPVLANLMNDFFPNQESSFFLSLISSIVADSKDDDPYMGRIIEFTQSEGMHLSSIMRATEEYQRMIQLMHPDSIPHISCLKFRLKPALKELLSSRPLPVETYLLIGLKRALEETRISLSNYLSSSVSASCYLTQTLSSLTPQAPSPIVNESPNSLLSAVVSGFSYLTSFITFYQLFAPTSTPSSDILLTQAKKQKEQEKLISDLNMAELIAEEEREKALKISRQPRLVAREPSIEGPSQEEELEETEQPDLDTVEVLPSPVSLPGLAPIATRELLGKKRLTFLQICQIQAGIYNHQVLGLLAFFHKQPRYTEALSLSLVEALYLAIEQLVTAKGIANQTISREDLKGQGHKLSKLCKQVGLSPSLTTKISKVTEVGSYHSRYPHINSYSLAENSSTGKILIQLDKGEPLEKALIEDVLQAFIHLLSSLEQAPEPSKTEILAHLPHFYSPEEPLLPLEIHLQVDPPISAIENAFPDSSYEKTDLMIHLKEFRAILQMINENEGLPKPLCAVILHAFYRIAQYATKNLLLIKLKKEGNQLRMLPKKTSKLLELFDLPERLEKALLNTDMEKGLDYPLGERWLRQPSEKESILLEAHHLSLAPIGFTLPDQKSFENDAAQKIADAAHSIVQMLEGLLNEFKD